MATAGIRCDSCGRLIPRDGVKKRDGYSFCLECDDLYARHQAPKVEMKGKGR